MTEPRGTPGPFTMDRTPPLKPQVPTFSSLSTINYLNETVFGSFMSYPKQDALAVPASSCNSVQPNGCETLKPAYHLPSYKQLRFIPSLDNPASDGTVTLSVRPTSDTVTSSLTVLVVQP